MQAQALLRDSEHAEVEVHVRFLQMVRRQVLEEDPSRSAPHPVDELEVDGQRWVSWDEAVEREIGPGPIEIDSGEKLERIPGGAICRSWRALQGEVLLAREPLRPGLWRITVSVANATPWVPDLADASSQWQVGKRDRPSPRGGREDALRQTFCSTHAVLRASTGAWVSLTDPPEELRVDAEQCENIGVWPVLVGDEHDRSTVLASPIILSDHPEIAPESPGDLFDSGEIDQMLVLNILAMTDEERREMRDSDPRSREILERTEALSGEQIMRLNGAVREFGLVRGR
jgi:hypothetical protein